MILLIDDLRNLDADIIARNSIAAIDVIKNFPTFQEIWFDHDLGDHVDTGLTVMKHMVLKYKDKFPKKIVLVTSNPVGRKNMADLLIHDIGYRTTDGIEFTKE